jgi:hypothetical protein
MSELLPDKEISTEHGERSKIFKAIYASAPSMLHPNHSSTGSADSLHIAELEAALKSRGTFVSNATRWALK